MRPGMSFGSFGADEVSAPSPGMRYVRVVLPSGDEGGWDVLEIDPVEGVVSTVSGDVFDDSSREALPIVVAAQALARSSGFALQLDFVLDPETGICFWEIKDDNDHVCDDGVGRTKGSGIRAWRRALSSLVYHAHEYAETIDSVADLQEHLDLDAPADLAQATAGRLRRRR